jgi:putative DNA primase/helicase
MTNLSIAELKLQRRWVLWRLETVLNTRGELVPTKVPYQRNGAHASSTDPATWCTHAEALATVGGFTGVGVMMGNGLGCTDLDHCVSDGKIMPWAREIIIALDSYSEFSPSGTGVHILGENISLPGKGRKRPYETGAVEVYDTARFLTFTGRWLPKTPADILPRGSQFNALYNRIDQRNGQPKGKRDFDLLMAGEWEKCGFPSMSEAVFVLCQLLNEKYDNDADKVDEQFRLSGLFAAHWIDKWERLGADTITKTRKPPEVCIGNGNGKPSPPTSWKVECFSEIVREEIDWIFESYAAKGKITGLSGEPGEGKSLAALDWAARYTTGRGWPIGTPALQSPGKVLVFATEDDAADTILPRFLSAGGDPTKLLRLRLDNDKGFYFDDPTHLDILRCVTEQHADIGMVIIDPILEHLRVNKEQTTREAYAPLRVLIGQRGIALIQIVHTNKRSADNVGSVGDKIGGVKALVGLPRFVYSIHKTEDEVRHLCRVKQNVGKAVKGSMDFRVLDRAGQPVIEWMGIGTATAQDALVVKRDQRPDCAAKLLDLLHDGDNDSDVVRSTLMDKDAEGMGFSLSQTQRAVSKLRLEGKLEVVKLPGGKSVWRRGTDKTPKDEVVM